MADVSLGNVSPIALLTDPETGLKTKSRWANIVQSTTNVHIPMDRDFFESMRDVVNLWSHESSEPPVWVECAGDALLEGALRKHFGCGAKPEDWENIITGPALLVPLAEGLRIVPASDTDLSNEGTL